MLSEVLIVNGETDVVLFENFSDEVEICLFNPKLKTITSR